jgi:hypothetical protein
MNIATKNNNYKYYQNENKLKNTLNMKFLLP